MRISWETPQILVRISRQKLLICQHLSFLIKASQQKFPFLKCYKNFIYGFLTFSSSISERLVNRKLNWKHSASRWRLLFHQKSSLNLSSIIFMNVGLYGCCGAIGTQSRGQQHGGKKIINSKHHKTSKPTPRKTDIDSYFQHFIHFTQE